jgi:hypothetical protein
LGQKVSDGSQLSAQFPCGHQQPQQHNKQEWTTFILPYESNKQHSMDMEGFHWLFGVVQGWFSSKLRLGSKNQWWIPAVSTIFLRPPTATGT